MLCNLKQLMRVGSLILFSVFVTGILGGCKAKGFYKNDNHGEIKINLYSSTPVCHSPAFLYTDHLASYHCVGENNYKGGTGNDYEVAGYCIVDSSELTTPNLNNYQIYYNVLVDCASGALTSYNDTALINHSSGSFPAFLAGDELLITVTCVVQGEKRARKTLKFTNPVESSSC